jgi:predicted O-methyltransferase YrrM
LGPGFQPPDGVPGYLTIDEGRALFNAAAGRDAIELGTAGARATVCLAQGAKCVVTVDIQDQGPAIEWARRFGVAERVEFRRGDVAERLGRGERFGLAFVNTEHDEVSVRRDLELAVRVLEPGGLVAVHDYPDPAWPAVRTVVDEFAGRLGWKRIAQADYLGVFRTTAAKSPTR